MKEEPLGRQARECQFGLHRIEWEDEVNFELPYGEWIRLFRSCDLVVEELIETRPPVDATTSYRGEEAIAWARKWPMEQIWRLRKPAGAI